MSVNRAALWVFCLVMSGFWMSPAHSIPSPLSDGGPARASTRGAPLAFSIDVSKQALQASVATNATQTTFYGPPYFHHGYANFGPWGSVGLAIQMWWQDYQRVWGMPNCTFRLTLTDPNTNNGWAAGMNLENGCNGGNGIYATAYPYKPTKNTGKPCNCVGDPINFGTGNEYRDDQDLALKALSLHRYYNSDTAVVSSHIGAHWRHSFDRSLESLQGTTTGAVTVYRPDGRQVIFYLQSGAWVTDPDVADTLSPTYDASNNIVGWNYVSAATREQESYDAQGRLLSIADVNKQLITFTYSDASTPASVAPAAGLLLTAVDPVGRQLSFAYNSQGNVATVTQPDGGVVGYTYDAIGNLTQVTYPDTKYRQYVYNESALTSNANLPNALTGELDENGARLTDIGYDSQGRAILSRLAGSVDVSQVSYGANGSNAVTYPTGVQVTYGFATPNGSVRANSASSPCGPQCGQGHTSATFDANGYPASTTDFNGHLTQTTYNTQGLLITQVDASGESTQRTTTTTWDTTNRVPLTRLIADASGATQTSTSWVYNNRAQVTAQCDIDPSVIGYTCAATGTPPAGVRRTIYTYCDAIDGVQCPVVGLLLSVTGPRTDITSTAHYSYYLSADESGCGTAGGACHRAGDLYQVTDAVGHVSTMVAYDKNGRVVRERDANGVVIDSTYHARGWLLTVRSAPTPTARRRPTTRSHRSATHPTAP